MSEDKPIPAIIAALPPAAEPVQLTSGDVTKVNEAMVVELIGIVRTYLRRRDADNNTRVTFGVTFLLTEIVAIEDEAGEEIDGEALFEKLKLELQRVRDEP